ncbi:hypothetical protein ACO2Q0_19950 [Phenylobacterium sp. VNQ135]|uniref:hypothetical protein n=1 Tax=Phenylobacterium sp. VNQ135 TaxID=3400922 RepID=UPI003C04D780
MDVIFTIVSRNYAAQAATLMQSLSHAEPAARRIVVAADGPIPELAPLAEVIEAAELGAPVRDMSVYYEALELNTAVKPFAFRALLAQTGVTSVTYLDPDIYVFRPLEPVWDGLRAAPLALTPHTLRPLTTPGNPTNADLAASGRFNLGFLACRPDPQVGKLIDWWAERCRFDSRVAPDEGIFTDQRWMDQAPDFVPNAAILDHPGLNLAYWNLEGRELSRTAEGWRVDGRPLIFFHFSGFDPARPLNLSKHQNRFRVLAGSPMAGLLADYAAALRANGHAEAKALGYGFDRFASGRRIRPAHRLAALQAARAGQTFPDGLGPATEAWLDGADPAHPEMTRVMAALAADQPAAAYPWWFAPNAQALGADRISAEAASGLRGPADPAERFRGDELTAWWIGPMAVAGEFAMDALPDHETDRLLASPAVLARAAELAETERRPSELRRLLFAAFGLPHRAGWPARLRAALQAPHLAPDPRAGLTLFREIWDVRPDLQKLYPLDTAVSRFRYLRWLLAGGLAEYGAPPESLPEKLRGGLTMRVARASLKGRR